jgi:uncharacterized membrane protein
VNLTTYLPNLHAAINHAPVVLLPVALLFELAGLALRRQRAWLGRSAALLLLLATLGAWAAVWSGERAEDGLEGISQPVRAHIHEHEEMAEAVLYALAALTFLRLIVAFWDHESRPAWPRFVSLIAGLTILVFVAKTADLGGRLVYHDGLAVNRAVQASPPAPSP